MISKCYTLYSMVLVILPSLCFFILRSACIPRGATCGVFRFLANLNSLPDKHLLNHSSDGNETDTVRFADTGLPTNILSSILRAGLLVL